MEISISDLIPNKTHPTRLIKLITHKENQLLYGRNVWRELFPSSRDYTHYSGSFKVYARLDYFFMFEADRFKV